MAHMLAAGHRLEINQTLVSPNGRFTLLMQTDGNMVLYQDGIGVKNAYWSSKSNWLPKRQAAHLCRDAGGRQLRSV